MLIATSTLRLVFDFTVRLLASVKTISASISLLSDVVMTDTWTTFLPRPWLKFCAWFAVRLCPFASYLNPAIFEFAIAALFAISESVIDSASFD